MCYYLDLSMPYTGKPTTIEYILENLRRKSFAKCSNEKSIREIFGWFDDTAANRYIHYHSLSVWFSRNIFVYKKARQRIDAEHICILKLKTRKKLFFCRPHSIPTDLDWK